MELSDDKHGVWLVFFAGFLVVKVRRCTTSPSPFLREPGEKSGTIRDVFHLTTPMFGKSGPILPNIGKTGKRAV
jgi:hypothetical protein